MIEWSDGKQRSRTPVRTQADKQALRLFRKVAYKEIEQLRADNAALRRQQFDLPKTKAATA